MPAGTPGESGVRLIRTTPLLRNICGTRVACLTRRSPRTPSAPLRDELFKRPPGGGTDATRTR